MAARDDLETKVHNQLTPSDVAYVDQRLATFEHAQRLTRRTAHLVNDPFFEHAVQKAASGDLVGIDESRTPRLGVMPASETWTPFPSVGFQPLDLLELLWLREGAIFRPDSKCDHCSEVFTASELEHPCALWMSAGTVVIEFHFCRACGLFISDRFGLMREAWREFNGPMYG